jgi:helicase MOV-10
MNQCDLYKKNEKHKQYSPAVITKLLKNFRSHEKILALPNRIFYDNELKVNGQICLSDM